MSIVVTLIYLMFLHFVADFLLQSRTMATNKSSSLKYLVQHVLIQFTVFTIGVFWLPPMYALANACIHGLIDWHIWRLYKFSVYLRDQEATTATWKYYEDHLFYTTIGLDQMLHVITILVVYGCAI